MCKLILLLVAAYEQTADWQDSGRMRNVVQWPNITLHFSSVPFVSINVKPYALLLRTLISCSDNCANYDISINLSSANYYITIITMHYRSGWDGVGLTSDDDCLGLNTSPIRKSLPDYNVSTRA